MFKKFLPFVLVSLIMTGCVFNGPNFAETHSSGEGLLLEEVLPYDTWFALSISTLDDNQQKYFSDFISEFTDTPDEFRNEILSGIDENLATIDLSYIDDIQPILGEEGVRFMLALSEGNDGEPITHAALTLKDPELAEQLFEDLESEGRFVRKVVKDYDLYFNVYAEQEGQDVFYFAVYEDLFLIANDSDELAEMIDLAKSKGDYSLWSKDIYQAVISELPVEHVGLLFMDGGFLAEKRAVDFAGMGLSDSIAPYLSGQGVAFVADEDGLKMSGIALGDREKIDADDASLDELQARKRYLASDMPGANLGVYMESYDLAKAIKRQMGDDDEGSMLSAYMTLLGLDPENDISEFLGEGYAMSLHENSGFLPGLTIMADVSGDEQSARSLLASIDAQISGLLGVFQLQGGTIAEAITKTSVEVMGSTFDQISLDLDSLMGVYDTSGTFSLPDEIKGQTANLVYGIVDDLFVISTYEGFLEDFHLTLDQDETYKETLDQLKGYKEGIVYVNFDELTDFMNAFEAFRDALRADAEALSEGEEVSLEEGGEVVEEEVAPEFDWEEFLAPLKSGAFSSNASKYEVKLGGVVLLDEN